MKQHILIVEDDSPLALMVQDFLGEHGFAVTIGTLQREPDNSIHIGADLHQPVGDYKTPNLFFGTIENLTFKYPNGT